MQKIIKRSEKGITLVMLVITIIVLSLISISTIMNISQNVNAKKYSLFKADIESLTEAVQLAYQTSTDISGLGPQYIGSINQLIDKNENDNDTYYLIDLEILNSKISEAAQITLNYGTENKTYKTSTEYNATNKTFGTNGKKNYDAYIINSLTHTVYYCKGAAYNGQMYYRLNEPISSFNTATVNPPALSKGMIPIKATLNTTTNIYEWKICSETDSEWYNYSSAAESSSADYNNSLWANVMLSDGRYKVMDGTKIIDSKNSNATVTAGQAIAEQDLGSMFVWIPRYAYKITSGLGTSTAGKIEIKFLKGNTDVSYDGQKIGREFKSSGTAMTDFVVHPSFRDGTSNHFANGEWDEEITGFWVAKFPAGYQASTITQTGTTVSTTVVNETDSIVYSDEKYTGVDYNYVANAIGSLKAGNNMSYPVFKPLTFSYNCIRIGDSYTLAKAIQNGTSFYGLSNIDSHMEKNSEWGAVAYLAHSNYGRNGTEININNFNMNNSNSKNTYGITGLYGAGTNDAQTTTISSVNAYNTITGTKGSSTGNATGVYDLNGCTWERVAGYITNGSENLSVYGSSFAYTNVDDTPQNNSRSSKWATAYPYDKLNDTNTNNWTKYNSYKSQSYGFGDALLEISTSGIGSTNWNADYSYFIHENDPFFVRGGYNDNQTDSGEFAYIAAFGESLDRDGFRIVLIIN